MAFLCRCAQTIFVSLRLSNQDHGTVLKGAPLMRWRILELKNPCYSWSLDVALLQVFLKMFESYITTAALCYWSFECAVV